jgi:hypothetical protein
MIRSALRYRLDRRTGVELLLGTNFFQTESAGGRILCDCGPARYDNNFHSIDMVAGCALRVAVCTLCHMDLVRGDTKCRDLSFKQPEPRCPLRLNGRHSPAFKRCPLFPDDQTSISDSDVG